jgi:hypothetical protein
MPVIGKNMISWFYAYVEHIEIKAKTVNIIHFPYHDLSQNVKIRDEPVVCNIQQLRMNNFLPKHE